MIYERIPEQNTDHAKSMNLNILNEVSKSVCKLKISGKETTGFFFSTFNNISGLRVPVKMLAIFLNPQEKKSFHIGEEIEIISNDGNLKEALSLKNIQHKITSTSTNFNFYVVQFLKENDQILNKFNFLDIDSDCGASNYENLIKKDVFILHYPSSDDLECSSGKIMEVNKEKDEFFHTLDSDVGSLGSPILLFPESYENSKPKVIGVYSSFLKDKEKNKGIFINKFLNELGINNQQSDCYGRGKKSKIQLYK